MQHCVPFTPCVQGPTALHEAAEDCDAAMVQLLLEHGANIKARTKHVCLQPLQRTVHSIPDAALAWFFLAQQYSLFLCLNAAASGATAGSC